ncbi:SDR family oxidoreductase [Devosia sediminis]|uniref:SDR family oxidoreductase n=1 Tax=Devosia sediminis TaxID=2798801 RepID=A0A934IW89_9HYPH|nr:SDR family oxidoreductase [Devosia sediminis]MBJ3783462.1 SDR family oxidoreductase [Devosia sediminis]
MSDTHAPVPNQAAPVALVTGAGDRIGAAIALALSAQGYAVVIHFRSDETAAAATRDRITSAGGRSEILKADLADRSQRASVVARAAAPFGPLTLLVNNASTFEPDSARDVDEKLWDAHFSVHAEAPIFLARDFAAQLPASAEGNIINIVDERVLTPSPAYFSYFLSKSVLWTATQTLAQSLAPQIRVNAIGPGPVLPNARQTQEEFDRSVDSLPLKRNAGPEAIAQGVLNILAMPAFTGQMLALDGGQHLAWPSRRAPTPRS